MSSQNVKGRYLELAQDVTSGLAVPLLSMREHMLARGMKPEEAHWKHDGHWNEEGHKVLAQLLLDYVARELICGVGEPGQVVDQAK